jgi:outer membrane PBP1 activator LpoA protein
MGAVQARVQGSGPGLVHSDDWGRFMATQASIARSPELARRVVAASGVPRISAASFLRHSAAEPQSGADILKLSVSYRRAAAAVRLTNAYAAEFVRYEGELAVSAINQQLRADQAQMKRLRALGERGSPAYALVQKRLELETLGHMLANSAAVLQPADGAAKVRPHTLRNGFVAGVIGRSSDSLSSPLCSGVGGNPGKRRAGLSLARREHRQRERLEA